MRSLTVRSRYSVSAAAAIAIVVIIIIFAVAGAYYFLSVQTTTTTTTTSTPPTTTTTTTTTTTQPPPQTFSFAFLHAGDISHAVVIDALSHLSQFNLKAQVSSIPDPASLTSATSNGQIDMFVFQFPTTTINAIEAGANVIGVGQESTAFLQDLVVTANITAFKQLNGTTMAAFQLDGPVLFPLVWAANGQNYSQYQINLVVIGESPVKAQALIAGRYVGAFLDPSDAAQVFKSAPGKFHILTTTASAFPSTGASIVFANKNWYAAHFQIAEDVDIAILESARNASVHLQAWINQTYQSNFTGEDYQIYNTTQHIYAQSDFFSPNMITYTPTLMNASDYFMAFGGLINSSGNVYTIYNFSAASAALRAVGAVPEPPGPFSNSTLYPPLAQLPANFERILGSNGLTLIYIVWYVKKTD